MTSRPNGVGNNLQSERSIDLTEMRGKRVFRVASNLSNERLNLRSPDRSRELVCRVVDCASWRRPQQAEQPIGQRKYRRMRPSQRVIKGSRRSQGARTARSPLPRRLFAGLSPVRTCRKDHPPPTKIGLFLHQFSGKFRVLSRGRRVHCAWHMAAARFIHIRVDHKRNGNGHHTGT
jgi:hypothetical protein